MEATELITDPLRFFRLCWPDIHLYDKQEEILRSVVENNQTIVPAGNELGKDFIAARIAIWFFASRKPCKVVAHSVDQSQLRDVLWGEIKQAIHTSEIKFPFKISGDIALGIRRLQPDGSEDPQSYLIGRVTRKGEGLLGRHLPRGAEGTPRTLFIADEGSGIDDEAWENADTWAHRMLTIGNPKPCTNFFFRAVKRGDIKAEDNDHYLRKIIQIRANQSPHVRLAEAQIQAGQKVKAITLIPGVLSYAEYKRRHQLYDSVQRAWSLDAEFPESDKVLLCPPDWLDRAEKVADRLKSFRSGRSMGIDSAEGNDNSCWAITDHLGLIALKSIKTADTNDIPGITRALGEEYDVPPHRWVFDRGGGGKQHADRLRAMGYPVVTVDFGEAATPPPKSGKVTKKERTETQENRTIYKNRRAELYGLIRIALNPHLVEQGFGLPWDIANRKREDGGPSLREQLSLIPLKYDGEGKMYLPPKRKRPNSNEQSLSEILGCSPDEADALGLSIYGQRLPEPVRVRSMV